MWRRPATEPLLDVLEVLDRAFHQDVRPHAWEVVEAAMRSGPTVHAILDHLEETGWLTGTWQNRDRARRRFYLLTPHGAKGARRLLATYRPGVETGSQTSLGPDPILRE
ncbi:PadR family transcriptional regulator [Saccharopolyspora sp. K220]|uniref:helix-turn-helix transcriptional regulator n=1 Tax=Saccharopolyspora soli TaxID=2926618 RepID=UPI001F5AABC2|nr:helix-turn-helix transcriptional regulator [Saccharopolyspora soli]MCI2420603.1 PadR family transcriptional regulator [Saccharopolyspora soli]